MNKNNLALKIAIFIMVVGTIIMMNGSIDLSFIHGFSKENTSHIPSEFFRGVALISMGLIINFMGVILYLSSKLK